MAFEVIVFENQSLYAGTENEIKDEKEAIKRFLDYCEEYSCYLFGSDEKEDRTLTFGKLYVSYADDSGVDKPLNILLLGKLTEESKEHIKSKLSFYVE
jgi:hypothetical protein